MSEEKHSLYNVKLPFPFKLHEMLEDVTMNGQEDIVSWQPHGKAFRVHNPMKFASIVMPKYFKQTHYKSFQRQLHMYGFHRITGKHMLDNGAYYHKKFVRGRKQTLLGMIRQKIKGTGGHSQQEHTDPDFYAETCCQPIVLPNPTAPALSRNTTGNNTRNVTPDFGARMTTPAAATTSTFGIMMDQVLARPSCVSSRDGPLEWVFKARTIISDQQDEEQEQGERSVPAPAQHHRRQPPIYPILPRSLVDDDSVVAKYARDEDHGPCLSTSCWDPLIEAALDDDDDDGIQFVGMHSSFFEVMMPEKEKHCQHTILSTKPHGLEWIAYQA